MPKNWTLFNVVWPAYTSAKKLAELVWTLPLNNWHHDCDSWHAWQGAQCRKDYVQDKSHNIRAKRGDFGMLGWLRLLCTLWQTYSPISVSCFHHGSGHRVLQWECTQLHNIHATALMLSQRRLSSTTSKINTGDETQTLLRSPVGISNAFSTNVAISLTQLGKEGVQTTFTIVSIFISCVCAGWLEWCYKCGVCGHIISFFDTLFFHCIGNTILDLTVRTDLHSFGRW
jgi:hypothetical protein